jgi:polar amino acid transport system substrate-binding protein
MKKMISLFIMLSMIFVVVGCGSAALKKPKEETVMLKREEPKKILKVGMELGYKPFAYYEEDETTMVGIDVDLAKAICKKMGYVLEVKEVEWENIFKGLEEKEYDIAISAVTINEERKEKYDFSKPYYKNSQSIVTLNQGARKPTQMIMLKGLKVGFLKSSTSEKYLKNYIKTKNIKCGAFGYESIDKAFNHLEFGKIDAIVCDSTIADMYCKEAKFEMTWQDEENLEEMGICLLKGSSLLKDINIALIELEKEGVLKELIEKYMKKEVSNNRISK